MVVKRVLEPLVEPNFHDDSYGYRPGKSALDAVGVARQRCWRYAWVLDLDIKAFFDSIETNLLMRAVRKHTDCPWVLLYIERWLKAPVQMPDGSLAVRERGTPQGGVISPILSNLFLHYAFDMWMHRNHPDIPFERYADDAICHCSSEEQAAALRVALENRFAECGLTLHPDKTKIVYCKDDDRRGDYPNQKFDFLGYTFRPRLVRRRAGKIGVSFSPAVSDKALKAIRQTVRRWSLHERSDKSLDDLARMFNAHIRGWINYYGRFYPSALYPTLRHIDVILARWACRKFKALYRHRTRRSTGWSALRAARQGCSPIGACPWPRPNNGSRMMRECHVRFCESAGVRSPRATHLVMLLSSEAQALELHQALKQRFAERPQLHPQKTRIVYCKDANRTGQYPVRSFVIFGVQHWLIRTFGAHDVGAQWLNN